MTWLGRCKPADRGELAASHSPGDVDVVRIELLPRRLLGVPGERYEFAGWAKGNATTHVHDEGESMVKPGHGADFAVRGKVRPA